MSELIIDSTDASFVTDVLHSKLPVLVDFWAPWCGPCVALGPLLERFAVQFAGRIKFVKLNVDENQTTRERYGARGLPLLLLFKGGAVHTRLAANTQRGVLGLLQSVAEPEEMKKENAESVRVAGTAVLPSFQSNSARKLACLARLHDPKAVGSMPSIRMAQAEGDAASVHADLPLEMNRLLDELWDVVRKTVDLQTADAKVVELVTATPVGAELGPLLLKTAFRLLHDPDAGVAGYVDSPPHAKLFERLRGLHEAELSGTPGAESEYEEIRKAAQVLIDSTSDRELRSFPQSERLAIGLTIRLERGLAAPLAEIGASWAFVTMLIADIMREEPLYLLDSELDELQSIETTNRDLIEASLGRRPASGPSQQDWSIKYAVLEQQLNGESRAARPGLFAKQDAWGTRQMHMAARLALNVCEFLVAHLPSSPHAPDPR